MGIDHRTRSLDEEGRRKAIHPVEVKGKWQSRRQPVQFILIFFFLAIPWISVGGRPLLRLNIFERKFSVFGVLFQSHDVPLLFLFVIGFALVFALATSLFGRVWCGWACPQTVFIEAVFRRIERWIEGSAFERKRNADLPLSERLPRLVLKWVAYLGVSLVITHSFLALFVGPEALRAMVLAGPIESPQAFTFILISTSVILFDFGWFREQFCIVMCPYGRIQSIFQDTNTFTVAYDARRGEPRGALRKLTKESPRGDCVDCTRCVQVCPTGIDIRNGSSQLECIACTGCVDACDDVMKRIGKPVGLIRYAPSNGSSRFHVGMRSYAYALALALVGVAVVAVGEKRTIAMVEVFKAPGDPYSVSEEAAGLVYGNVFVAEISGQRVGRNTVEFSLRGEPGDQLVMPNNPISAPEGVILRQPFTVRFAAGSLREGRREITLRTTVRAESSGPGNPGSEVKEKRLVLIGPF